jgi:hypothetical protein
LGNPVLAAGESGQVYLAWTDSLGAHVRPLSQFD